jgi:hypothetical protein
VLALALVMKNSTSVAVPSTLHENTDAVPDTALVGCTMLTVSNTASAGIKSAVFRM